MTNDVIGLLANLALTLSFLVAVVFGIAQVRSAARDRRERLTLESLRRFQTREFSELVFFVINRKPPASQKEFNKLSARDQVTYFQFAQEMESLGILVAEGIVDLDLVDKTLGTFVTGSWKRYDPMYQDMRSKLPDPFLGEYFQWLAERIDERMKNHPRKPFHEVGAKGMKGRRA